MKFGRSSVRGEAHYRACLRSLRFGFSSSHIRRGIKRWQALMMRASQLSYIPVSTSCRTRTRRTHNEPVVVPESKLGHGGRRGSCHSYDKMTLCLANWCGEQGNKLVLIIRTSISAEACDACSQTSFPFMVWLRSFGRGTPSPPHHRAARTVTGSGARNERIRHCCPQHPTAKQPAHLELLSHLLVTQTH